MRIKVSLAPGAVLPSRATPGSVGYDLCAYLQDVPGLGDRPLFIEPGERQLVPTGVYLELPETVDALTRDGSRWAVSAQIRPRSGLALKHGVTVLNTPGTIDVDYRGEVGVLLVNLSDTPFLISGGDRVGQLVFNYIYLPNLELVEELSDSDRGSGGFGSTGV